MKSVEWNRRVTYNQAPGSEIQEQSIVKWEWVDIKKKVDSFNYGLICVCLFIHLCSCLFNQN